MQNLTAANAAKTENHLNELIRYCNKFYTRRGLMNELKGIGWTSEIKEVPKYQYNRIKYNRMDGEQQAEYDKKLKERKTEYRIVFDGHILPLTKIEFEYFNTL